MIRDTPLNITLVGYEQVVSLYKLNAICGCNISTARSTLGIERCHGHRANRENETEKNRVMTCFTLMYSR